MIIFLTARKHFYSDSYGVYKKNTYGITEYKGEIKVQTQTFIFF